MKILAIMGSPRKGNTYRAVQRIEENMKAMGEVEFEYLWLKDAGLADCKGCTVCFLKGEQRCPLKDGRKAIEQKMLSVDGVIFASPNYASNVSGLMKTFIDRFAYAGHRPRFYGQYALMRGRCLRRFRWHAGASELLKQALIMNPLAPFLPDMEYDRAVLLKELKKNKEARDLFQSILKQYPNHPVAEQARLRLIEL